MRSRKTFLYPGMGSLLLLCAALSGCSILFPDRTAPKSLNYQVTPPNSPWHKLSASQDPSSPETMKADLAYENSDTGAIISLNSLCRKYTSSSLDALTNNLVRGIDERVVLKREEKSIDGAEALDTSFEGLVDNVRLRLRTVVLKKNSCTYDFIFVVLPKREQESVAYFETFLASFKADE